MLLSISSSLVVRDLRDAADEAVEVTVLLIVDVDSLGELVFAVSSG